MVTFIHDGKYFVQSWYCGPAIKVITIIFIIFNLLNPFLFISFVILLL